MAKIDRVKNDLKRNWWNYENYIKGKNKEKEKNRDKEQ